MYGNSRTETRSLREMVEAFKETNADGTPNLDKTAREALAEKILLRWAGAEGAVGRDYWGRWSSGWNRSNTQMMKLYLMGNNMINAFYFTWRLMLIWELGDGISKVCQYFSRTGV